MLCFIVLGQGPIGRSHGCTQNIRYVIVMVVAGCCGRRLSTLAIETEHVDVQRLASTQGEAVIIDLFLWAVSGGCDGSQTVERTFHRQRENQIGLQSLGLRRNILSIPIRKV